MTEENVEHLEQRARDMGWLPQEEFRGDPDNWKPAEDFIKLGETSLPHLKGTLKVMESKIAEQNKLIESMNADFKEFVQFSKNAEQRAYEKAIKDLQSKQKQAKEAGDLDAFAEVTEALQDKILEGRPAVATGDKVEPAAALDSPQKTYEKWFNEGQDAYDSWVKTNNWFMDNPKMFSYAQQMDAYLNQKHGLKLSRAERLEEMTKLVKKEFPDHFTNATARKQGSPVEGDSGGRKSAGTGRTFNDLPDWAQKQAVKWCGKDGKGEAGTIKGLTFEQYCQNFKW